MHSRSTPTLFLLACTTACGNGIYVDEDEGPPLNKVFVAEGPLDMNGSRAFLGNADPDIPNIAPEVVVANGGRLILPDANNYQSFRTKWVPDADSGDSLTEDVGTYGGDCPADGKETGPHLNDPDRLYPSAYCLREDLEDE